MKGINLLYFLMRVYGYPYRKYLTYYSKKDRENIIIEENEIDKFRFGFFGELGYALISWYPFLNFLHKKLGLKIKTVGLPGSSVFVQDFTSDHIELDTPPQVMWGDDFPKNRDSAEFKESLVLPRQKGNIRISDQQWMNNQIHVMFYPSNYEILTFQKIKENDSFRDSIIINIKNHYNWDNTSIKNFYNEEEIVKICSHYSDKRIYLNFPTLIKEPDQIYFETTFINAMNECKNLYSLDEYYSNCVSLSELNNFQISVLKAADTIFASQGGNAALAILCNRNVKILMRGGSDYPDYLSLSRIKNEKVKIAYETCGLLC